MTKLDLAHQRLHNQLVSQHASLKPGEVVRYLGAVQAQDYLASLWAIGLRLPSATQVDIEQAIADGTIVRTWPMRGTIHFVAPEDVRWMLTLLTPRVIARSAGRYRRLELDEAVFSRSRKVLIGALQGGKRLTRNALYDGLKAARIATANGRGLHILGHLAQQGLICFGPRAGKQPTFVLLDEWVPDVRQPARDEALAELARRYIRSHGPATLQDFMWWSGLMTADARAGFELVGSAFAHETVDGATYWFAESSWTKEERPTAYLLPWFDEYLVAYKDRSAALEPSHVEQVNAGGGLLNPTIVLNGRVVATWKRTLKDTVLITVNPFIPLSQDQSHAIHLAAARYGSFLGASTTVVL